MDGIETIARCLVSVGYSEIMIRPRLAMLTKGDLVLTLAPKDASSVDKHLALTCTCGLHKTDLGVYASPTDPDVEDILFMFPGVELAKPCIPLFGLARLGTASFVDVDQGISVEEVFAAAHITVAAMEALVACIGVSDFENATGVQPIIEGSDQGTSGQSTGFSGSPSPNDWDGVMNQLMEGWRPFHA